MVENCFKQQVMGHDEEILTKFSAVNKDLWRHRIYDSNVSKFLSVYHYLQVVN